MADHQKRLTFHDPKFKIKTIPWHRKRKQKIRSLHNPMEVNRWQKPTLENRRTRQVSLPNSFSPRQLTSTRYSWKFHERRSLHSHHQKLSRRHVADHRPPSQMIHLYLFHFPNSPSNLSVIVINKLAHPISIIKVLYSRFHSIHEWTSQPSKAYPPSKT